MAAAPSLRRASLVEPAPVAPEAAAAHELYERHAARLHGYCLHRLGSREEAEDAVQTTFMNAFRALRGGVTPDAEAAWLFKIAENVCLSRHRSSFRRGRVERPADMAALEQVVPAPGRHWDELIGLDDALAAMSAQQRRAIVLREWQGLPYREIAERLGVSQAAVETLIFRARRSLARGLTHPEATRRRGLRRARRLGDLASFFVGAKALFGGATAAQAAVAAVAVTAVVGTTATPVPQVVTPPPVPQVVTPSVAVAPAGGSAGAAVREQSVPSAPAAGASAGPAPRVVPPPPAAAPPAEPPAAPAARERGRAAPGPGSVAQERSGGRSGGTARAQRPAPPARPAVPARPPAAPPRAVSPPPARPGAAPARSTPTAARGKQPERREPPSPPQPPARPETIPQPPAAAAVPAELPPAVAEPPGPRGRG